MTPDPQAVWRCVLADLGTRLRPGAVAAVELLPGDHLRFSRFHAKRSRASVDGIPFRSGCIYNVPVTCSPRRTACLLTAHAGPLTAGYDTECRGRARRTLQAASVPLVSRWSEPLTNVWETGCGLGRPLIARRSPEPVRNPGWKRLSEAAPRNKLSLWILGTVSGPAVAHTGPSNATEGGLGRPQELGRRLYACALARPGFVPLRFAPVELHLGAPAASVRLTVDSPQCGHS
ncbi:uncharacterized protein LOC111170994 isoform X2 [Delphinapterus leucas]|uniref:Uncharacterized protein LOC111170994 isoform X2 n=1 Tax=Delphinapterus leucas TaxID=9749 RepID=A0A2Y9MJK8_DELLE|nr:uncharacterized protein LOC111170994 isoform X2 [Delphinapterus leucas]XP_022422369.1 uncharacterized protein LOC111170994 isoform X2 [Delphinapterus leucas]